MANTYKYQNEKVPNCFCANGTVYISFLNILSWVNPFNTNLIVDIQAVLFSIFQKMISRLRPMNPILYNVFVCAKYNVNRALQKVCTFNSLKGYPDPSHVSGAELQ